jgi:hypothetical protein
MHEYVPKEEKRFGVLPVVIQVPAEKFCGLCVVPDSYFFLCFIE